MKGMGGKIRVERAKVIKESVKGSLMLKRSLKKPSVLKNLMKIKSTLEYGDERRSGTHWFPRLVGPSVSCGGSDFNC